MFSSCFQNRMAFKLFKINATPLITLNGIRKDMRMKVFSCTRAKTLLVNTRTDVFQQFCNTEWMESERTAGRTRRAPIGGWRGYSGICIIQEREKLNGTEGGGETAGGRNTLLMPAECTVQREKHFASIRKNDVPQCWMSFHVKV